jgi:arginine metabolism regulation protein II
MSISLVANLGSNSVDESLAEIDAKTKDVAILTSPHLSIGPFGVLDLNAMAREEESCDFNQSTEGVDSVSEIQATPSSSGLFDPILDVGDTLQWADLFELDFENILMTQEVADGSGAPKSTTDMFTSIFNDDQFAQQADSSPPNDLEGQSPAQNCGSGMEPEYSPVILSGVSSVQEARNLLKHFQDCLVPQMSFTLASSKSPWRTLNLVEAVHTLAEMSYLGTGNVMHASAANLYALLGCAAYHLSANPTIQSGETIEYWGNVFSRCTEKAKIHMQISLRHELKGARKAKYKDQLMAILSMLASAVSIITFLLSPEKLNLN